MAMVSRQAEALGGHLFVQSREGEGSTFHFTVALYSPELSPIPETADWFPLEKR
jgi:signal transduction histidine kinase